MKPATGSNTPQSANKVSIQQSLDGHSFSVQGAEALASDAAAVEVEVLSERTMLVPREAFDAANCEALLAANGTPLAEGQQAVYSDPRAEIVAVMALSGDALETVQARLGERAVFTTPLLTTPQTAGPTVWMYLAGQLLYIKVYDSGLRLAEVVPATEQADLVYVVERLGNAFLIGENTLSVAGPAARTLRKLVGKRFGKVVCE